MKESEFIEFFKTLVEDSTEELNMNTEFRYLDEWSSLAGASFIAEMKIRFGKIISIADFKQAETIGDLYKLIQ